MLILVLVLACPVLEKSLMNHLELKVLSCLHVNYHCHINTHPVHRQSAYYSSVPEVQQAHVIRHKDMICLREGPILIFEMHDLAAYAVS